MPLRSWQREAIEKLSRVLQQDESVRGLVLVGSFTREDIIPDIWSDLDIVVIVQDSALPRFFPATGWAACLGETYCFSQNVNGGIHVTRAYYADGRRVDYVIIAESSLERIDEWPTNPLRYANTCLFSRSEALDRVLARTFPPPVLEPITPEQFERMAEEFWFKGMLAVSKVGRNEMLVALHLNLDMVRDCLLLGMMIRDRETGTDHHRDGTQGNHLVTELASASQPYTPEAILESIEQSAIAFDRLAAQWDSVWQVRRCPLLEHLAVARRVLNGDAP